MSEATEGAVTLAPVELLGMKAAARNVAEAERVLEAAQKHMAEQLRPYVNSAAEARARMHELASAVFEAHGHDVPDTARVQLDVSGSALRWEVSNADVR